MGTIGIRVFACKRRDVERIILRAGSEIVRGSERGVQWFGVEEWEAFAAIREMRGGRFRLFNCWVNPRARGCGIGIVLVLFRIEWALLRGAKIIDTRSRRPQTFASLGFAVGRRYKCGVTHCELRTSPS